VQPLLEEVLGALEAAGLVRQYAPQGWLCPKVCVPAAISRAAKLSASEPQLARPAAIVAAGAAAAMAAAVPLVAAAAPAGEGGAAAATSAAASAAAAAAATTAPTAPPLARRAVAPAAPPDFVLAGLVRVCGRAMPGMKVGY